MIRVELHPNSLNPAVDALNSVFSASEWPARATDAVLAVRAMLRWLVLLFAICAGAESEPQKVV